MPNQTPHTPQNQTPSPADERVTFAMKPPIISPEIYERFEQLIAKPFSPEVIEACNKAQREKREREEQNQLQEFIEINGILLETENLGRPQNPKIQILNKGDKIIVGMPYCWNNGDDWYYNWYAAMIESDYLGKRLPTDPELSQLFGSEKDILLTDWDFKELTKKLNIKPMGNYCNSNFDGGDNTHFWASTESANTDARGRYLSWNNYITRSYRSKSSRGFSVRCIFPEKEEPKEKRKIGLLRQILFTNP